MLSNLGIIIGSWYRGPIPHGILNNTTIWVGLWTHDKHPIAHLYRWAIGCLLWIRCRNVTARYRECNAWYYFPGPLYPYGPSHGDTNGGPITDNQPIDTQINLGWFTIYNVPFSSMLVGYYFCMDGTWEYISVYWQQGTSHLWVNCFMSWMPASNKGARISDNFRYPLLSRAC